MNHDYKPVGTLCLDKVNAHRMIYADAAVFTLAVLGNSRLVTISHDSTKMSHLNEEGEPLALAAWSFSRRQPQSIEILVIKKI